MEQPSNPAWIGLLVSGILNLLWALIYLVWTLVGLALGGFAAIIVVLDSFDKGDAGQGLGSLIYVVAPIIQTIGYLVFIPLCFITIFAAFRLKSWKSKGVVWVGALLAVGTPILGLVLSFTSFCNAGAGCACCFGFLGGNIGTLPVLLIGLIATAWTGYVLFSDEGKNAFAMNAQA